MYFLMRCHHHPGKDAERDTARPRHREWVRSGGDGLAVVLIGSAMIGEDGTSVGNFGILQADNAVAAQAFAKGDPFFEAGIVARVEIERLADTFQADRIPDPMTTVEP